MPRLKDLKETSLYVDDLERAQLSDWEASLEAAGVGIISRVVWPRGGESIYFRDPDNHLLELLTPGVWATY